MRLLVITQKMDKDDPVLGFFHNWIMKLAPNFEEISVICLEKGNYKLPENVKIYSLGKENGESKIKHVLKFFYLCFFSSFNYDAVFVHMNQEYILLGGLLWKIFGKRVYMWRNHHAGNLLTDLAAAFCNKVFCTSKYSYTAKYGKNVLMPVGVDIEKFKSQNSNLKIRNNILFLGRIAQTKNPHIFIEALAMLQKRNIDFTAHIYGDALPKDLGYYDDLLLQTKHHNLQNKIKFFAGVPNEKTPEIYNAHEIYVNLSSSGMYDKTIFEAFACGCLVLASNDNLIDQIDDKMIVKHRTPEEVSDKLQTLLDLPLQEKEKLVRQGVRFAGKHSLELLTKKLTLEMQS